VATRASDEKNGGKTWRLKCAGGEVEGGRRGRRTRRREGREGRREGAPLKIDRTHNIATEGERKSLRLYFCYSAHQPTVYY